MQGYHERMIMPCVTIDRSCYSSTVSLLNIWPGGTWSRMSTATNILSPVEGSERFAAGLGLKARRWTSGTGFLGLEDSYVSHVLCSPMRGMEYRHIGFRCHSCFIYGPHKRLALPHPLPYSKPSLQRGGSNLSRQPLRVHRRHIYIR